MSSLTEEDKERLWYLVLHRLSRHDLPWRVIERNLPGVPRWEIIAAVQEMEGITLRVKARKPRAPRWSTREKQILKDWWGLVSFTRLMEMLPGRTANTIARRAIEFGCHKLRGPIPGTHVTASALSEDPKWGYGLGVTNRILKWAKIPAEMFSHRRRFIKFYSRQAAFDAAVLYERAEVPAVAARRWGVHIQTIWEWLRKSRTVKTVRYRRNHRELPETYDALAHRYLSLTALVLRENEKQQVREDAGQAAA